MNTGRLRKCLYTCLGVTLGIMSLPGAMAAGIGPGTAGGIFEIDGNLKSAGGTDWQELIENGAPAGEVFVPLDPDGTKLNSDGSVFAQSDKVFHDPITYNWKSGSVPQKDDLENCNYYLFTGTDDDLWIALSGDRLATNGTSYIDFEFLQAELRQNSDGTFSTLDGDGNEVIALHDGRTKNDTLITIELSRGGDDPGFFVHRWLDSDNDGVYTYEDVTDELPDFNPMTDAFVAANVNSSIQDLPYLAFGENYYEQYAFGEAALNVEKVLLEHNECRLFNTMFIRTKSSDSPSAQLKDFCAPINVNICLDETPPELTVPENCPDVLCENFDPGDLYSVDCGNATAVDNCDGVITPTQERKWVPICGKAGYIIVTWTAVDKCGNKSVGEQIINVIDETPPDIDCAPNKPVECDKPYSFDPPSATDNCTADEDITITPILPDPPGVPNPQNPCYTDVTRTWVAEDECGNKAYCSQTITLVDTTDPVITCAADKVQDCDTIPEFDWPTATDNCTAVNDIVITEFGDIDVRVNPINDCWTDYTRTWEAKDLCGNTDYCSQTITLKDTTKPEVEIVGLPSNRPLNCDTPYEFCVVATDNCDEELDIDLSDDGVAGSYEIVSIGDDCYTITFFESTTVKITAVATDDCDNESDEAVEIVDSYCDVDLCESGKPITLEMRYDKGGCEATTHSQDSGSVTCKEYNGGVHPSDESVYIIAGSRDRMNHKQWTKFFEGTVANGQTYTVDGSETRRGDMVGNTTIFIYRCEGGDLLEQVTFHTSCSQPLITGSNHYGSSALIGGTTTGGNL